MKTTMLICAGVTSLLLAGCASTTQKELAKEESRGSGLWHMVVREAHTEAWQNLLLWRHGQEINPTVERLVTVRNSPSILETNPFKNTVGILARVDKSLNVEEGDYVELKDAFKHKEANTLPKITKILCRKTEAACIEKINTGLQTAEGATVGSYIWLPF